MDVECRQLQLNALYNRFSIFGSKGRSISEKVQKTNIVTVKRQWKLVHCVSNYVVHLICAELEKQNTKKLVYKYNPLGHFNF